MAVRRKSRFKRIFVRTKRRWRPRKKKSYLKLIIALLIVLIVVPSTIAYMWFKKNILDKLPDVSKIENIIFSQTTTITDRNWIVLYKVFDENRKYVKIDKISKNMQNAIIAAEDRNFWKNPWIDLKWIIRAGFKDILLWQKQWASTITQQLIKNLLLTTKKTIKRKLKEIVLAFKLNKYLTEKIKNQYKWLTDKEIKKKVKEKILEMYLNYVFLWNNSYWVEAAAKTYFKKNSQNLDVLESAILASIPKSPVKYDPLLNKKNNLWYLEAFSSSGTKLSLTWTLGKVIQDAYISYLKNKTFSLAKNDKDIKKIISPDNLYYKKIHIKYTPWRKDYVLSRMYIDWYIDKDQFIQALKEWFNKKIYSPKITIKAPHFVFMVLKKLEKKYWKDVIEKAWWTIKTSLDYKIQKLAEQSVQEWSWYLDKKWANNTALLYIDSKNGDILAYVWSKDFYNKKIDWQVDMIVSKRQCWSVMKPLIYTNAFIKNKTFTPDTPIYDTYFPIADKWHSFNNFDWKFLWLLPIRKALPYSRNIPAAKMYFLWWWEYKVKNFLKSIWLKTISDKIYYWYPLAIWAAEVTMYDMAQAYSYLSNIDGPVKINPILEIRWPDNSIIYKKTIQKLPKIISSWVISMIWYILSNPANRPPSWNYIMQIPWLKIATKSWTTNIIDSKTKRKYPRDWWFIAYTPSKVFITWAWNTKWEHMNSDAFWWWTAWKVWRGFVMKLKKEKLIQNENMYLKWTTSTYVNTINWKKSSKYTPVQISKQTIARIDGIPQEDDGQNVKMIQIDTLCTWLVSKYTPKEDIKYAYVIKNPSSHRPNDPKWQDSVDKWWKTVWVKKYSKIFNAPVLLKEPTKTCKSREIVAEKWMLDYKILYPKNNQSVSYVFDLRIKVNNAPFKLKKIELYVDWKLVETDTYKGNIIWVYLSKITNWIHTLVVKLTDEWWYSVSKKININIINKDTKAPFLEDIKNINNKFAYIFKDENSRVLWWKLNCNWQIIRFRWPIVVWPSKDCKYQAIDYYGNMLEK